MKRRITFFSRLAAGLLTVLLALPQSAWADGYPEAWGTYDKTTRTVTKQVSVKLGYMFGKMSESLDEWTSPASNNTDVVYVAGVSGGFEYGAATMGVGTAVVSYKTLMNEYYEITQTEYEQYKANRNNKPTGWNDNSYTCVSVTADDDFYGIKAEHYYRLDVVPDWSAIEYWTVSKGDPTLSWKSQTGIMNIGGTLTCATPTIRVVNLEETLPDNPSWWLSRGTVNIENPSFTYVSSDPTIATVAADGSITALKAGEVTITITWAGDDNWNAAEASYKLTVEKGYASVYFSPSSLTITEGDTFTEPEATTDPAGLPLTYSSNNEAVATVDATTGKLTIVGAGDATITATFAGNDEYREASRSYTLTVNERPKEYVSLSFDGWLELEIGQTDIKEPTLNNPQGVSPIVWSSDDESVVTVNQNGKLTIVGLGRTFINATFEGNATYYPASVSYAVSVLMPCDERYFVDAEGNRIDTLEMGEGETVNLPSLYDPATKTTVAINSVYGEKYGDMVTITDKTSDGYVFGIYGYESAVVEFMAAVWDEAKNRECSYPIVVRIIGKAETGLSFSTDYAEGYVGKAFKAPVLNNPNKLSPIVWQSSNTKVATVSEGEVTLLAAGKTVISASYAGDDTYREGSASYSLNVIEGCPDREFRDKDGNALDTLVVTVGDSVILGEDVVLYDLASAENVDIDYTYFSTDAKAVEVYTHYTYLSKYDSIATKYIIAKEEGDGTVKASIYERASSGYCYYDLYVVVKPVIVPVPDDEETTFDFSVIGPDGSDMLSVSLGANDSYNEEEGRLEIASTATEEDVTAALEAAVPGSSAFMSLLPSSISFEVEEGEGDIEIDCQTLPGFVLKVRINGVGEASLSSTVEQYTRGKATVHYNVSQKTYVVIYLQGAPSSPAPARIIAATADDDPNAGAYIYGIKVTPKKSPSSIENVQRDNVPSTKVLREGQIYILRGDKTYTVTGQEVK